MGLLVASLPVPGVHASQKVRAGVENFRPFWPQLGGIFRACRHQGSLVKNSNKLIPLTINLFVWPLYFLGQFESSG